MLPVATAHEAYAAEVLPRARGRAVARIAEAHGMATRTLSEARSHDARLTALSEGGRPSPSLTRARLRWESLERTLSPRPLVLAPSTVPVWLGGQPVPSLTPPR